LDFGNVVAVVLLLAALAIMIERILNYRRHRPASPLTDDALAQLEAAAEAARLEEERDSDAFWEVHRAAVRKLMQDLLQQTGASEVRLHEDRAGRSMSLVGRSPLAGLTGSSATAALVTISVRQRQFYYVARHRYGVDGVELVESPPMQTLDDLRKWVIDMWTYEE
jgi:hypothetical protein